MTNSAEQLHREVGAAPFFAVDPPPQKLVASVRLQVAATILQGLMAQHGDEEYGDDGKRRQEPRYDIRGNDRDIEFAVDAAIDLADRLIAATGG